MIQLRYLAAAFIVFATVDTPVCASLDGTLSNFDVFNDTTTEVDGAELELEGIHSSDVSSTYPSHFRNHNITEYSDGSIFGVRITFEDYFFNSNELLAPTVGNSTNGHFCVNVPGCEHYGFSVRSQPSATRYYWLDQNLNRVGNTPMSVPTPIWSYVPP